MYFISKVISFFLGIILLTAICFAETVEDTELVVSLTVNYEETDIYPTLMRNRENNLLIPFEDIKHFGIQDQYLANAKVDGHDTKYINLDLLPGTKYHLNQENLDLNITFPVDKMQQQNFNAIYQVPQNVDNKLISGAFFNYNLTLTQGNNSNYLAGVEELNYFAESGVYSCSFLFQSEAINSHLTRVKKTQKNHQSFTRLETNWTFEDVENMTNWRVGDSFTKAAYWSNSTRFLGAQYATNFAVRPNLVTYPLLDFAGKSELPSSVEIYSNAIPIYNTKSGIGNFDISNIPVITGRGDLIVKTQDITGKVETITIPYYASPNLLRPGLSNFSYEAGLQRQNFTVKSNQYKYFVINTDYMYGINDYLTSGGHFEFLKNNGTVGATNNFKVSNYGVVGLSLASNLKNIGQSQRVNFGYTYESQDFDINSNLDWNNKYYQDVYGYPLKTASTLNYQISASYGNQDFGNISVNLLSFVLKNNFIKSKRSYVLSSTYQQNITKKGYLSFTLGTDLKNRRKYSFAYMSFTIDLGNTKSVTLIDSYQNNYHTKQLNFSSPVAANIGWGYTANIIKGKTSNYNLQVNRNGETNDAGLYLYKNDQETIGQLNLQGAIVAVDNSYFMTRPITGSLAVVKVNNLKDIGVYNNNSIIGYTDEQGRVLIPNVIPYVSSEIRLDDENLPLNTQFPSIALSIAPKSKSAVLLDFEVKTVRSVEMTMLDGNKHNIPFDRLVTVEGLDEELFVGYEGKVYIQDINNLEVLKGSICNDEEENNKCCHFNVLVNKDLDDPVMDLGAVICE